MPFSFWNFIYPFGHAQRLDPASKLVPDLMKIIFTNIDLKSLARASRVSRGWRQLVNSYAGEQFGKLFPHALHKVKDNHYKQAFIDELYTIPLELHECGNDVTGYPYIFRALEGNINIIVNASLSDEIRTGLYILALSNGHLHAMPHLNNETRGFALNVAAKRDYAKSVKTLLTQKVCSFDQKICADAFMFACTEGSLHVFHYFMDEQRNLLQPKDIAYAFDRGISGEQANEMMFMYFLQHERNSIEANSTSLSYLYKRLLELAARRGWISLIKYFFEEVNPESRNELTCTTICHASFNNKDEIMQYVWEHERQQFSVDEKGDVLKVTANEGGVVAVSIILSTEGHSITALRKEEALTLAKRAKDPRFNPMIKEKEKTQYNQIIQLLEHSLCVLEPPQLLSGYKRSKENEVQEVIETAPIFSPAAAKRQRRAHKR
jgi:hypothetical protein